MVNESAFKQYHVFTDGRDAWLWDFTEAKELYARWCKEHDNVRLYLEVYETEEELLSGRMIEEICLANKGDYPL